METALQPTTRARRIEGPDSTDQEQMHELAIDGMTCAEAAEALQRLGAHDAINLDGGGSSTLFIGREGGVVSHVGERWERPVSSMRNGLPRIATAVTSSELKCSSSAICTHASITGWMTTPHG